MMQAYYFSSVLQPNSPRAVIKTALESAKKTRLVCSPVFYVSSRC